MPFKPGPGHDTRVWGHEGAYWLGWDADCWRCKWTGPRRQTLEEAREDKRQHDEGPDLNRE